MFSFLLFIWQLVIFLFGLLLAMMLLLFLGVLVYGIINGFIETLKKK